MISNGDVNLYEVDPYEWDDRTVPTAEEVPGLFEQLSGSVYTNNVDYFEILGFTLLNFDTFAEKLEPLR
jgi:hypothetical protein